MYFIDDFFHRGEVLDSSILISKVNLDGLDDNRVQLCLKPYFKDVELIRKFYHDDGSIIEAKCLEGFEIDCEYDREHDRIELLVSTGFDLFIYTICVSLNIGRVSLIDNIEKFHDVYSINSRYVSSLILTLDEFKQLDGFAGQFDIRGISIQFVGMRIHLKHLFENVCDDFERPDGKKEYMLRGEKLFRWID